jgi:leucyl aminopeptidase
MKIEILKPGKSLTGSALFFIEKSTEQLLKAAKNHITKEEINFLKGKLAEEKSGIITINRYAYQLFFYQLKPGKKASFENLEDLRKTGNKLVALCDEYKTSSATLLSDDLGEDELKAAIEGIALSVYQFAKFKSGSETVLHSLKNLSVSSKNISEKQLDALKNVLASVYICRDFVNEPVCNLNSEAFSEDITKLFKNTGAKLDILNKIKIEALKMNGLLSVNKGSVDPPAFVIIEWKPATAKNKKPIVFVGKGLMFDTGGINIKTGNNMETMKCDMAGGAAVVSAIHAIVSAKLPVYVIGLIPVTDNRPSGNSLVPGDIITYSNGTTVEVLNSDAEGRLILADGIIYAGKYKPAVIITIATLTGAAHAAIGGYGMVGMQQDADKYFSQIQSAGNDVFERIVEFPFWDEYDELIKSEIADIKNIGGSVGGAITAGKFLAHFTKFPFIHLDIAGPAFNDKKESYRGIGGSGVGVRLFYEFIKGYRIKGR